MARSAGRYHLSTNSRLDGVLAAWLSSCSTHRVISETICLMCSSCRMTHLWELSKHVFMLLCEATVCRFWLFVVYPKPHLTLSTITKDFFLRFLFLWCNLANLSTPQPDLCQRKELLHPRAEQEANVCFMNSASTLLPWLPYWSTVCWKINTVFFPTEVLSLSWSRLT